MTPTSSLSLELKAMMEVAHCTVLHGSISRKKIKIMIHVNRVHHIAIICSDYERTLEFYKRVLGFTVLAENYREESKGYKTDLALGNQYVIELFSFPSPPVRPTNPEAAGLRHLAFEVDDILAEVEELERMGVEHEAIRIDPSTNRRFMFFHDPDGLPLELYEK